MIIGLALLWAVLIYGKTTNQATSWFNIWIFNFQPSEIIKIIAIVFLAVYYDLKKEKLDKYSVILFPLLLCAAAFGCIILQPDLGTAIIFISIVAFMFFFAPIPKPKKVKIIFFVLAAGFVLLLVMNLTGKKFVSDRQQSRFDFTEPCSEKKFYTEGNQVCNSYIAVNNGGLTGKGLGNSTQKYLYLPEAHTDFIFAILLEELGLIAGIVVIILYMLVLARIITIGRRAYTISGTLMCYAVAFYIFLHIVVNMTGIFGLLPMTGVPLPFMSYGGSFTLCLVVSLSIVQRVCIETKIIQEKRNR